MPRCLFEISAYFFQQKHFFKHKLGIFFIYFSVIVFYSVSDTWREEYIFMQPITQNKKRIKVQHIIGKGSTQVNITRNVTLPTVIRKIVDVHAEIVDLDYEIIPDKIIIKGALHKQIYYVEEGDYVVKEYTIMREEFTDFLHVPGATPQMDAVLDGKILYVDTNAANDGFPTDTIFQIAVVAVDVTVVDILTLDVVTDVHGEGITATKELFSVESLIGTAEKQVNFSTDHVLDMNAKKSTTSSVCAIIWITRSCRIKF